ncbi:MAG: hypothetical protein OXI77_07565 [Chloroflexota bacterium]|nr:hypothetical protein [Chloroflexota bacterium]MDE2908582.1 hypothetical protein [Chloroflexota bacterium]
MTPVDKSKARVNPSDGEQIVDSGIESIPSKEDILEDIRDGYVYVMSGGVGQPIDDVHREIAEELAREELAENADICS